MSNASESGAGAGRTTAGVRVTIWTAGETGALATGPDGGRIIRSSLGTIRNNDSSRCACGGGVGAGGGDSGAGASATSGSETGCDQTAGPAAVPQTVGGELSGAARTALTAGTPAAVAKPGAGSTNAPGSTRCSSLRDGVGTPRRRHFARTALAFRPNRAPIDSGWTPATRQTMSRIISCADQPNRPGLRSGRSCGVLNPRRTRLSSSAARESPR